MSIIGISGKMQSGKNTVASIIQYLTSDKFKASNSNTFDKYKSMNYNLYKKGFIGNTIWQQVAFASKLKQIVSILTGIPVEDLEKQEVKNKVLGEEWWYYNFGDKDIIMPYTTTESTLLNKQYLVKLTVRQLLQEIGTEAMRNVIHPNIWVNALFSDYNDTSWNPKDNPNWIITDMRFPNELQAVKNKKGITIRVNRIKALSPLVYNKDKNESYQFVEIDFNEHPSETALDNAKFDYTIDNNGTIKELIEKVKKILIKEKII